MKCMVCGNELEAGKASFMGVQGFPQMICSFISETEKKKGFFKRKGYTRIISSGEEIEAYYCSVCKRVFPAIQVD